MHAFACVEKLCTSTYEVSVYATDGGLIIRQKLNRWTGIERETHIHTKKTS